MIAESFYIEAMLVSKLPSKTVVNLYKDIVEKHASRDIELAQYGVSAPVKASVEEQAGVVMMDCLEQAIFHFRSLSVKGPGFGLAKSLLMAVQLPLDCHSVDKANCMKHLDEAEKIFSQLGCTRQMAICDLLKARLLALESKHRDALHVIE